jgi:hypothetical protein
MKSARERFLDAAEKYCAARLAIKGAYDAWDKAHGATFAAHVDDVDAGGGQESPCWVPRQNCSRLARRHQCAACQEGGDRLADLKKARRVAGACLRSLDIAYRRCRNYERDLAELVAIEVKDERTGNEVF